jgi:hypothetical protein
MVVMNNTTLFAIVLATSLTALPGCAERDAAAPAQHEAPAATATATGPVGTAAPIVTGKSTAPATGERKLVRSAELHVEVASYQRARAAVDAELGRLGGYLADAEVQRHDGEVVAADLELRVPSHKLNHFMASAGEQGRLLHESIHAQDVTDAHADLSARLANARRFEKRLLELVSGKAESVKALVELEREIARVRQQIEGYEGQLQRMDKDVAMSRVKLRLVAEQHYAASAPLSFGATLKRTIGASAFALVALLRGLLLALTALLPWLAPIALSGWGVRRWWRRRARGTAAAALPSADSAAAE